MKKLTSLLLTLALFVPAALFAQSEGAGGVGGPAGRHGMPSVDDQLEHLSQKLDLTDAQKPQVKAVLQGQRDQMRQLMQNSSGSNDDNRAKMREVHEKANAKIRGLLTDDQKDKFDKMQAEQRKRWQEGHEGGNGATPPQQ